MSEYIPFEIQAEIMKKLPVKSLLQFRSVSKRWKSLIDDSDFIKHYNNSCGKDMLLSCEGSSYVSGKTYVSIADDSTFPHHKASLTIPVLVNTIKAPILLGYSHGLFCFYGTYTCGQTDMAVLCNFSIRKSVGVVVPFKRPDGMTYENIVGFGVCPDIKIFNITKIWKFRTMETIPWQVEVFTLSTGTWRSPSPRSSSSNSPPRKSIKFFPLQVFINGFLYWLAQDLVTSPCKLVIISLDMTSEEFGEINLPERLELSSRPTLSMSKSRESLILVERKKEPNNVAFGIWIMDDDGSFTNRYTVNVSSPRASFRGFRNSGELIFQLPESDNNNHHPGIYKLVVYDPYSKRFHTLRIDKARCASSMSPYKETLLLLDQPNLRIYNEVGTIKLATPSVTSSFKN